jgi:hypothetical protein
VDVGDLVYVDSTSSWYFVIDPDNLGNSAGYDTIAPTSDTPSFSTLTVTGAATIGGTLAVTGAATFNGAVSITSASSTAFPTFQVSNNNGLAAYMQAGTSGSGRSGTYFGQGEANSSIIFSAGASSNGLLIGSFNAKQVVIGTNNTAAISIHGSNQIVTFSAATYHSNTARITGSSFTTRIRRDAAIIDFVQPPELGYADGTVQASTLRLFSTNGQGITINTANQVLCPDGSAGTPSLSFLNDTDTGIYRHASDHIGFAAGGNRAFLINGTATQGVFYGPDAASNLEMRTNGNIYLQSASTGQLTLSSGGGSTIIVRGGDGGAASIAVKIANTADTVTALQIMGSGLIRAGDGTASLPAFTFISDPDCGMYRSGANAVSFSAGGIVGFSYDGGGFVGGIGAAGTIRIVPAAGTAAAPALTFNGDTDTGIYSNVANGLAISLAGSLAAAFQQSVNGSTGPSVYLKDLSVAPSVNPVAGGYLYSVGGSLRWRGSSGTVTTIAPA